MERHLNVSLVPIITSSDMSSRPTLNPQNAPHTIEDHPDWFCRRPGFLFRTMLDWSDFRGQEYEQMAIFMSLSYRWGITSDSLTIPGLDHLRWGPQICNFGGV